MGLKILIIDDEVFVRKGVMTILERNRQDVEWLEEAYDGKMGLELIRSKPPDIVITDIRMPNIDGLQLIRMVREQFPHIRFLILSVLEEFPAVREALQLGVTDYISKLSMTPEQLLEAIDRVKREKAARPDYPSATGNESAINDSVELQRWVEGADSDMISASVRQAGACMVACIRFKPGLPELESDLLHAVHRVSTGSAYEMKWYRMTGSNIVVVFFFSVQPDGKQTSAFFADLMKFRKNLSIGVSSVFTDCARRTEAWQQARTALEEAFYSGDGHVHHFNDALPNRKQDSREFFDSAELSRFFAALESEDEEQSRRLFERLFPVQLSSALAQKQVRDEIYTWVSSMLTFIKGRGGTPYSIFGDESPFDQIIQLETYEELRGWCDQLLTVIFSMLANLKNTVRYDIKKAMDYVGVHYRKPLRVKEIADLVHLSENYFSNIFVKETGKTFSQYVLEVRIEKATEMLRNHELHWIDVGERVGFDDPKYFAKVFKRKMGVTPKQLYYSRH